MALSALSHPLWAQATYRHHGAALLPDKRYTPGVAAIKDKSKLCPHANTAARRHVTDSTKVRVCQEYGVFRIDCNGKKYEIDHVISLELGGSNDIKNLFPEPYESPGAHEKDEVENLLHNWVCTGRVTLGWAQKHIADDWYSLYLEMNSTGGKK